ncbi:MAG: PIN domain-containing protein [Verrucomicrobiota bacterium]
MRAIADTGFLVAFVNSRDKHHDWAMSLEPQINGPLLTCEAVLAETAFHLQDCRIVIGLLQDRFITLALDVNDHIPHLDKLAERYKDRKPDFADLCLIRLSELNPDHSIITTDRTDFTVYRRNKREVIPIICPPKD